MNETPSKRVEKFKRRLKENWMLIAFLVVIVGAFVLLRSKPSDIQDVNELSAMLTDGQPAVLEFYSNI